MILPFRHPVGALAEPTQVGREYDVAKGCEHVRVVVARSAGLDAAHVPLARTVAVDREHCRPGRRVAARVRNEQVRGDRHRVLDVEHDPRTRVRAAVDLFRGLEVERYRGGVRAEHLREAVARLRAPGLVVGRP